MTFTQLKAKYPGVDGHLIAVDILRCKLGEAPDNITIEEGCSVSLDYIDCRSAAITLYRQTMVEFIDKADRLAELVKGR